MIVRSRAVPAVVGRHRAARSAAGASLAAWSGGASRWRGHPSSRWLSLAGMVLVVAAVVVLLVGATTGALLAGVTVVGAAAGAAVGAA